MLPATSVTSSCVFESRQVNENRWSCQKIPRYLHHNGAPRGLVFDLVSFSSIQTTLPTDLSLFLSAASASPYRRCTQKIRPRSSFAEVRGYGQMGAAVSFRTPMTLILGLAADKVQNQPFQLQPISRSSGYFTGASPASSTSTLTSLSMI